MTREVKGKSSAFRVVRTNQDHETSPRKRSGPWRASRKSPKGEETTAGGGWASKKIAPKPIKEAKEESANQRNQIESSLPRTKVGGDGQKATPGMKGWFRHVWKTTFPGQGGILETHRLEEK